MQKLTSIVRQMVSQDKVRYVDGEFDLDLTYITANIIAMGFPSSGFESTYRNPLDEVARFLEKYHANHYLIFNLAERTYDYTKFNHQVLDCGFPNHYNPPLELFFETVNLIHSWLSSDEQNVAVIHCLAGRGRTGTIIAGYLVFTEMYSDPSLALEAFALKRSGTQKGVTYPSQKRYVQYLSDILSLKRNPKPLVLRLKYISMNSIPNFDSSTGGCRPMLQVFEGMVSDDPKFSNEDTTRLYTPGRDFHVQIRTDVVLCGDVVLECYHKSAQIFSYSKIAMFRCSFHTSFLDKQLGADNFDIKNAAKKYEKVTSPRDLDLDLDGEDEYVLIFWKEDLDGPHKDVRFPDGFCIKMAFTTAIKGVDFDEDTYDMESRWTYIARKRDKRGESLMNVIKSRTSEKRKTIDILNPNESGDAIVGETTPAPMRRFNTLPTQLKTPDEFNKGIPPPVPPKPPPKPKGLTAKKRVEKYTKQRGGSITSQLAAVVEREEIDNLTEEVILQQTPEAQRIIRSLQERIKDIEIELDARSAELAALKGENQG